MALRTFPTSNRSTRKSTTTHSTTSTCSRFAAWMIDITVDPASTTLPV
jgi:hypothetical protein